MKQRRLVIVAVAMCAMAVLAVVVWRSRSHRGPLTPEEKLALIHDTNVAIGQLENGDYHKSASFFDDLTKKVPDDPLGYRNLAIACAAPTCQGRLDPTHFDESRLLSAIDRMVEKDGKSPQTQRLASRLYFMLAMQHIDDSVADKARLCLKACAQDSKEVGALYDLYLLEKGADSYAELSDQAVQALRDACNRDPRNIVLRWELLRVRVANNDSDRDELLGELLELLSPSAGVRDTKAVPNLSNWLDDVQALAKQAIHENPLYNKQLAELQPDAHSFLVREFSSAFCKSLPAETSPYRLSVSFRLSEVKGPAPTAIAVDDLNSDGHLIAVSLYAEGDSTRIESSPISGGVPIESIIVPGRYNMLKLADLDLDFGKNMEPPDLDLILAGASGVRVLENQLESGKRRWVDYGPQPTFPLLSDIRSIGVVDIDNKGLLDIVLEFDKEYLVLRNRDWRFQLTSAPARLHSRLHEIDDINPTDLVRDAQILANGTLDYDNDGLPDIWLWTDDAKNPLRLFHNEGHGKFSDKTDILPPLPRITSPPVVVDIDGNGGQDFVLTTPDGLCYLMNQGGNKNHWLDVRLQSTNQMSMAAGNTPMTNFSGIGCTIEIRSGTHYQRQLVRGGVTHFGLGNVDCIDTIRVAWTNGIVQNLIRPDVDKLITIVQRSR
jgi:hypothetical protein